MSSLLAGVAVLFIFRRGVPHVAWIVGYLILLWLLFTLYTMVRQSLEERPRRFVITAMDYTIQSLCHGLLLFILPGYFASTTFTSANVWFFLLLVGLALLTTVDPWYRVLVLPRRLAIYVLFGVSIFVALNVALPLVGVRPARALFGSVALAGLALTPTLGRLPHGSWRSAWLRSCLFAAVALAIVWPLRSWIPPAPLHLARATMARTVSGLEPAEPLGGTISIADLQTWGGLVAYTAVYAPAGVRQPIVHIWRKEGRPIDTIDLSPIRGGRREGFRTYSRKTTLGDDAVGRWTVDVVTESGQLVGRLRFTVTP